MADGQEIERKYLVRQIPEDLSVYEVQEITQAYLCIKPVIRVRSIGRSGEVSYVLTVKGGGMVVREEHELPLEKEQYEFLLQKKEGRVISKKRYRIPLKDGHIAELDAFEGELAGLYTVEVEFESVEEMDSFTPPEWFGQDVSQDLRFKNSHLCISHDIFR